MPPLCISYRAEREMKFIMNSLCQVVQTHFLFIENAWWTRNKWNGNTSQSSKHRTDAQKSAISEICTARRAGWVLQLVRVLTLLCEPGLSHLSHAFHFAPRAPNMLCLWNCFGMIFYATIQGGYLELDGFLWGFIRPSEKYCLAVWLNK